MSRLLEMMCCAAWDDVLWHIDDVDVSDVTSAWDDVLWHIDDVDVSDVTSVWDDVLWHIDDVDVSDVTSVWDDVLWLLDGGSRSLEMQEWKMWEHFAGVEDHHIIIIYSNTRKHARVETIQYTCVNWIIRCTSEPCSQPENKLRPVSYTHLTLPTKRIV